MAEAQMPDMQEVQSPLAPRAALGLLRQVHARFAATPDHLVLQRVRLVLQSCRLPAPELGACAPHAPLSQSVLYVVHQMVNGACGLLRDVYLRIEDQGLTSQGFQSQMKSDLNDIIDTLKVMNKFLDNSGADASDVWFVKEKLSAAKIVLSAQFSKEYPYQTHPKLRMGSNSLWSKIKKMSLSEMTDAADEADCIVCLERLGDSEFAILDSCPHIVCVPCAHRLFNLQTESDRKCPMCRSVVKSYTSSLHAARYKASSSVFSSAKKTFKSLAKSFFDAPQSSAANKL